MLYKPNRCCIKCRKVSKVLYHCSLCGAEMENVGHNWRLPKKGDDKGWAKVQEIIDFKRKSGWVAGDCPTLYAGDYWPRIQDSEGKKLLDKINRKQP